MIQITLVALVVYLTASQAVEVVLPGAIAARSSQYFAQNHLAAIVAAPPATIQYNVAPSAATFSQFTQFLPFIASPVAAPLVTPARVAPIGASPVGVGPVAAQQPQPALNPDAESVEIESARIRVLPQVQNLQQQELRNVNQEAKVGGQQANYNVPLQQQFGVAPGQQQQQQRQQRQQQQQQQPQQQQQRFQYFV